MDQIGLKTLIIDNYDSFTHILKQYVGELGGNPVVYQNDQISLEEIEAISPTHILLSPGPGTVLESSDIGIMPKVIEAYFKKIPILGVCLGHQALAHFFGGKIVQANDIMHGKRSLVFHYKSKLFEGLKSPTEVMRYHSLMVEPSFYLSADFEVVAHTSDMTIMGIEHNSHPLFGLQFHPESLGSENGKVLIKNFLEVNSINE